MRRAIVAVCGCVGALLSALAGCGGSRLARMDQTLLARRIAEKPAELGQGYVVHFPDVLEVRVEGLPEHAGPRQIGMDGRIAVGNGGVQAEGQSLAGIAAAIATELGLSAERVSVSVAEFNSQKVFLHGEVKGDARAVDYRGPETVLELLRRTGGITPGAAPGDIHVVRSHVAEGRQPEVFEVDLEAILLKNDEKTNVRIQPFDQIYVGQTRKCFLKSCVPPWLRPIYDRLSGMARPPARTRPPSAIATGKGSAPTIRLSSGR